MPDPAISELACDGADRPPAVVARVAATSPRRRGRNGSGATSGDPAIVELVPERRWGS